MTRNLAMLLAVAGSLAATTTFALEGESIVFNPTTGNYLITFIQDGTPEQITFIPRTKISPIINSGLKLEPSGEIHYAYSLISNLNSQQDIRLLILDPVSSVATPTPIPPVGTFSGDMTPTWMKAITDAGAAMSNAANSFDTPSSWKASMAGRSGAFRVGWGYSFETGGLSPGGQAKFGFKGRDLPGIIQAEISGYAPGSKKIPGEVQVDAHDGGFGQQYTNLIHNNFVPRPAAVPAIAVPTPFNAATLLNSIQTQMHGWIAMNLLDPTFSAQLDRSLTAAIDAYGHNQPKAGKENIEELRRMLRREHANLDRENEGAEENASDAKHAQIALLAARVLDFDLNYVLQRMEKGHD